MKRYVLFAAVLLFGILLAGCGAKEEGKAKDETKESALQEAAPEKVTSEEDSAAIEEELEGYDLMVKQEKIFDLGLLEKNPQELSTGQILVMGGTFYSPLGTQFLNGEPVQIWAERSLEGSNIYLYRKDGSSELLAQNVPSQYIGSASHYQWYIDGEGDIYCYGTTRSNEEGEYKAYSALAKILSSGEVLYENKLESDIAIEGFCQTEDGRICLLLQDESEGVWLFAEADPATGELLPDSQKELPVEVEAHLGVAGDSPALTGWIFADNAFSRDVVKMDTVDGSLSSVLNFTKHSYGWHNDLDLRDFQVLEDGAVELLWTDYDGVGGLLERLWIGKVENIPIVVRGVFYGDPWLLERVALFNAENSTYHVIIEDGGIDSRNANDVEEFYRLTSVQIGAGAGPDILCGVRLRSAGFLADYIMGMLEKGALEELNPYMEASGIREEDYFPLTFAAWRQGERIYSVNYRMSVWGEEIDAEILGSRQAPDIETLADALLARGADGVYHEEWDSGQVLKSFLQGTDSLWGMVDWESGSCDFNTPLFGKLLEAAKRYGDDGRRLPESYISEGVEFDDIFHFKMPSDQEEAGVVSSGTLFDEGCYVASYSWYTMAINANSLHKEGAWEFISYLIGEESQGKDLAFSIPPVNKKAFEKWLQDAIYEWSVRRMKNGGWYTPAYYGADTSEERQEAYRKALEEARPLPLRTAPILTIILEEANDYFNGYKSAEEVSRVVNNRVQLYLDERK